MLKTGQETSYRAGDDGDLELGIGHDYEVLSTGSQSGTTSIIINGKTHALSNNCVRDNNVYRNGKPIMWARYAPTADIGPAADGKLFWEQYTLGPKTDISFDAASKEIRSAAAEFDTKALCAGRKHTITGSANNNITFTVVSITTSVCVVSETVVNEAAGASVSIATVDDLIWDFREQANTGDGLGGFTDWEIPNYSELHSLVNLNNASLVIDTSVFPSTPADYYWTSSTNPGNTANAFRLTFEKGSLNESSKRTNKHYCRLVRG